MNVIEKHAVKDRNHPLTHKPHLIIGMQRIFLLSYFVMKRVYSSLILNRILKYCAPSRRDLKANKSRAYFRRSRLNLYSSIVSKTT